MIKKDNIKIAIKEEKSKNKRQIYKRNKIAKK